MKRNMFGLGIFATFGLLISGLTAAPTQNVVLFFGDDAGFQLGAYNNTVIKTPNFDVLASRSVIFKHSFTSVSSCSPSRATLLTGLPEHQNGQYGLAYGYQNFQSFENLLSLPSLLSSNGVRTGLIGKKHVKPDSVYKFDYERSDQQYDMDQIGRNITFMKGFVREFLRTNDTRPFFLYVAFHDPHRCDVSGFGQFCERWGDGQPGNGVIQDWAPQYYKAQDIPVPNFLPDTLVTRQDLANMYTTYSRMDQGLGLFMKELTDAGFLNNTLVIYTSDNGIPFPNAKTNLYDPGQGEPLMISSPLHKEQWGKYTDALASTTDLMPTILDWFNIKFPNNSRQLTGKSLLPLTVNPNDDTRYDVVYSSQNLHEVNMYYPMRVIRTSRYKLIHNLQHRSPFVVTGDILASPTMQDILNRTIHSEQTVWFKGLQDYYFRDQFELFDLQVDPDEIMNVAYEPVYASVLEDLKARLKAWQNVTQDPWRCSPSGQLVGNQCWPLFNGES